MVDIVKSLDSVIMTIPGIGYINGGMILGEIGDITRFSNHCRSFRTDGANYGRCPSKKETPYGFKVHALITIEGYITAIEITPASVDDREGLRDFAENHLCFTVLGDKGYTGETLLQDMRDKGICLMSLKPSNYKQNGPRR